IANLRKMVEDQPLVGNAGIGHTRWATHGLPNNVNAHPHISGSGDIALVHNGIIENYATLKKQLTQKGRQFYSETDSEVVVQLIEEIYDANPDLDFEHAVRLALKQVVGTYGLAIVHKGESDQIIVARKGSPLLLGVGENETFIASDASPIVEHTQKVV